MNQFTPVSSLVGGVLIGISATILLLFNGRAAGISGILSGIFDHQGEARSWRVSFLAGLLIAGLVGALWGGEPHQAVGSLGRVALAGGLVGFGTLLGEGCTSGHGVCGISRLSVRSILATVTFIAAGMLSVWITFRFQGGLS